MKTLIFALFICQNDFPWQSSMRLPTQNIIKSLSFISGAGLSLVENSGYKYKKPQIYHVLLRGTCLYKLWEISKPYHTLLMLPPTLLYQRAWVLSSIWGTQEVYETENYTFYYTLVTSLISMHTKKQYLSASHGVVKSMSLALSAVIKKWAHPKVAFSWFKWDTRPFHVPLTWDNIYHNK